MHTPETSLAQRTLLWFIVIYRNSLRLLLLPSCRFVPSCSEYAEEALRSAGAVRGSWHAVRRIVRCNPLGGSGMDPVR